MNSDVAIKVEGLTKTYKIYENPIDRLKEGLNPFKKDYHRDFNALNQVSFELKKGDALAIIGKNGSGKSTLLKIITGVLTPSSGKVTVNGKISALLELGAGFNPEYTGLENIYLNGTIMGYSKEQVDEKIEDILNFADIGEFIKQPVKSYSSGMFARLAFAVAINVDPDILIVDEALSVGDIHFQAKCYRKFDEFKEKGKTILFVSHSLDSVIRYCNTAILLDEGQLIDQGSPKEMVDIYKRILTKNFTSTTTSSQPEVQMNAERKEISTNWKIEMDVHPDFLDYGDKKAEIIDFGMFDQLNTLNNSFQSDEITTFRIRVRFNSSVSNPIFAFVIKDIKGMEIAGTNTWYNGEFTGDYNSGDEVVVSFSHQLNLQGGTYTLSFGCTGYENDELVVYHRLYDVIFFRVVLLKSIVGIADLNTKIQLDRL
ncbi:ABC transporter ATP-binding protein [Paenibacillus sp. W2I17]|uniref:ABC transporter ATP-binding protein n=1 Tax=Paenibacillus sp. W2I17 TaxID=3042311 RepID=UPI00278A3CD0|nr:ABC transporter ATP-binding protein [Paenibacillus sp. W2I17]MDQ0660052.1 teichoic acid transport system ATP-binding protein [Paenibacillus sp. W2I17]